MNKSEVYSGVADIGAALGLVGFIISFWDTTHAAVLIFGGLTAIIGAFVCSVLLWIKNQIAKWID